MSTQQRRREYSSDSLERERIPSDDLHYQGMLKSVEGRKGIGKLSDAPAHDGREISSLYKSDL